MLMCSMLVGLPPDWAQGQSTKSLVEPLTPWDLLINPCHAGKAIIISYSITAACTCGVPCSTWNTRGLGYGRQMFHVEHQGRSSGRARFRGIGPTDLVDDPSVIAR